LAPVLIDVANGSLVMHRIAYHDEIRWGYIDEAGKDLIEVPEKEMELGEMLVESMRKEPEALAIRDERKQRILEKISGVRIEKEKRPEILELKDVLLASIERAKAEVST